MRRFFLTATAATMAIGLLTGTSEAAPKSSPVAEGKTQARVITNRLKLLSSRVSNDTGSQAAPAGFSSTLGAATTLVCPNTATLGCVITFAGSVQVSGATANNDWAICPRVNGSFLPCPFIGRVETTNFNVRHWETLGFVGRNTANTVDAQLFFDFAATRNNYTLIWEIHRILP